MTEEADFEAWVKANFAQPWSAYSSHLDIIIDEPEDQICLKYISKLFRESKRLEQYLDEQVNRGLTALIDPSASNYIFALYNEEIPLDLRLECLSSFSNLFEDYFAKHCSQTLNHIDQRPCSAVNNACYMWWDIIPLYGHPEDKKKRLLDQPILDLLNHTLKIDSIACKESALHGLGHWHLYYPKQVEKIIDEFLKTDIHGQDLQSYAMSARTGCIN